jgi:hypothetical protein
MRFIKLGKINKKFLIPVLGGIFRLIHLFLIGLNPKYEIATKNPFILNIYTSIGMIFSFIPCLILKYRSKTRVIYSNATQMQSKLNIELIFEESFEEIRLNENKKYKLIICSSIFDFLQVLLLTVFCIYCNYNLWIFDILFMSLFSYLILKTKLYKHQYFSMIIIIIILGFILNIIKYFNLGDTQNKLDPLELFMKLLSEICFSLSFVIIKYNMEKTYCSPYEICIWEGLFALILNIFILVIINQLKVTISGIEYPNNFYELFDNYDINDFILCFVELIMNAIFV